MQHQPNLLLERDRYPFVGRCQFDQADAASTGTYAYQNSLIAWSAVAILLIADLVWFSFSRLKFEPSYRLWLSLGCFAGLCALYLILAAISRRLRFDRSRMALAMRLIAERCRVVAHAFAFNIALFASFLTLTYLSTALAWPLRDAQLASIDRMLGFDWKYFLALTNSIPLLSAILVWAYKSSALQLLLLCLFLSATGRQNRLAETLALMAVTVLLTGIFNLVVPAAGAYELYAPAKEMFSNFSSNAGMWHLDLFLALRQQAVPILDFANVEGLVTFPSFHTILAIVTAYGLRDVPYLRFPVAALSAIVIVATLPEGGHYLIDVIAGAGIAVAAIIILGLQPRPAQATGKLESLARHTRNWHIPVIFRGLSARDGF
jgi:membrane-associated phospholipid phosphatase